MSISPPDIAAFRRQSHPGSLHLVANGCPDHAYFQHGPLQTTFSLSGDSACSPPEAWAVPGDCSSNLTSTTTSATSTSTSSTAAGADNPFYNYPNVPRFVDLHLTVPATPVLALTVQRPEHADQPMGIAINGVLLFPEHTGAASNSTRSVDNCGGHADTASHFYHYHSPPVCLLLAMSATVPATGARYLQERTAEGQVSHWPARGQPSGVLGVALDGFFIYVS